MDFGITTYEGLTEKYFIFPVVKQQVLPGTKFKDPKIYIGLGQWGRTEWIGKLYPKHTRQKDVLIHYARRFNSVELNATHYKITPIEVIKKWKEKAANEDFLFCPKMYSGITHRGSLKGKAFHLKKFLDSVSAFGGNLGPIFIQIGETFSPNRINELIDFLKALPATFTFFLELRHQNWFSKHSLFHELQKALEELKIGLVITDAPNRRDLVHMQLTIPEVFIRFVCFGDNELDRFRIRQWKVQLNEWFQNGLRSCYFFIHPQNEVAAIDFAKFVQEELESCTL